MASKPIVRVIGTGGTIASISSNRLDLTLYSETGHRILIKESLDRVPEVHELAEIQSEDLMSEASGFIGPSQWPRIARHINHVFREEPEVDGIVLTHGTGTMEETAYFLQLTLKSSKPVVMTGAMRPASALGTDADLNLYNAIRVAAHPDAAGKGVLVVLNNQIHSGRDVTKTDPLHVETFKDYDMGLLGYGDPDGEVVFYRSTVRKHTTATPFDVQQIASLPRVDIVSSYAGSDALLVEANVIDETDKSTTARHDAIKLSNAIAESYRDHRGSRRRLPRVRLDVESNKPGNGLGDFNGSRETPHVSVGEK
mgnify:CR=1 FL=1